MSYRTKIILTAAVGYLFLLILLAALTLNLISEAAKAEVKHQVSVINSLLNTAVVPIAEVGGTHLKTSLDTLSEQNFITYLHLYDGNGSLLAGYGEHVEGHSHSLDVISASDIGGLDQSLEVISPSGSQYSIHYGLHKASLIESLSESTFQVYALVVVEVLLIILGTYLVLKGFSKQLAHIREASIEVAKGNLSYRVCETKCSDLKEAARAFNLMSSRLEQHYLDKERENLRFKELTLAVEQSPVAIVMTDSEGLITYANPSFFETSGYSSDEVLGKNPRLLQSGETEQEDYVELWESITHGETWTGELKNRRKDGSVYWDKTVISPVSSSDGKVTHYISVKEDVTEYKKTEERMRVATTVFDAASEAIMVTDLDGVITMVNPAFYEITGYRPEEVLGQSPKVLNSGHHDEAFYQQMFADLKENDRWEGEIWNRRKSGEVYPQWQTIAMVRDEDGEPLEFIALFSDITKRKEKEDEMRFRANYDALTCLPNRSLFSERLAQAINLASRDNKMLALLYLDLDGFKPVNDQYGHLAGDNVLQEVALRLKATIRESDCVARIGGDEFVLFLTGLDHKNDAAIVASKIIESVGNPIVIEGHVVSLGVSVGIALYPSQSQSPEKLVKFADLAMYQAKKAGKNCYRIYRDGKGPF